MIMNPEKGQLYVDIHVFGLLFFVFFFFLTFPSMY